MSKLFFCFLFITLFSIYNFAQIPTPSPIPIDKDDIVKIETNLIQIDVVVTDKDGNEITNLKPEDFEVYENDSLVKLTNFSYNSVNRKENSAALNTIGNVNPESVPPKIGQIRRTVAIVIDDLRLSGTSINYVKKSLTKFINEQIEPNDLIAIIKTSGSIGILQQFTTDKKILLKSIENIEWKPLTSVGTSPFPPIEISFSEQVAANILGALQETPMDKDAQETNNRLQEKITGGTNIEKVANNFRADQFTNGTLSVLLKTIGAMNQLAGRKSIIFVVEGLTNISGDESKTLEPSGQNKFLSFQNKETLRQVTDLANRSAISIYPLDPRGVQAIGLSAADSTRGGMFNNKSSGQIDQEVTGQRDAITRSQDGLKVLADETGGKAFINNNDLEKGFKAMMNSQNGYYLLAYQPDSETFDANNRRFNKLTVKVKRPNVNVTYRSGFFNVAENPNQNKSNSNDAIFVQRLLSPYRYDDVNLSIASIFAGDGKSTPTIRSFINIKPADLEFVDTANGRKMAQFDLIAIAFDENGIPIARLGRGFSVTVKPDDYAKLLKDGISCNLSFAAKDNGIHQVKVAVRDLNSKKIGTNSQTINIPDFNKTVLSLSGILLENYTVDEWKGLQNNTQKSSLARMQKNTANRQFKKGTVLTYTYVIYISPEIKKMNPTNLTAQVNLLKDGKEVFRGTPEKINPGSNDSLQRQNQRGAFMLGTDMSAGDYTLQVVVGSEKQSLNFELVD